MLNKQKKMIKQLEKRTKKFFLDKKTKTKKKPVYFRDIYKKNNV